MWLEGKRTIINEIRRLVKCTTVADKDEWHGENFVGR